MVRVRTFDLKLTELGEKGEPLIHIPTLGQEAPAVAACATLNSDDVIMPYHRGYAWAIGKGMEPGRVLAELLGRTTGYCKGQSGANLADWDLGVLGRSGIQGAHLQIAAGVGLALRTEGRGRVCLAFFGDGASNTGAFHEGLNLAALWNSAVVYICENNGHQGAVPWTEIMRVETTAERAPAYGIPGVTIDGNDVVKIFRTVSQAIERARGGAGPTIISCRTHLWAERHFQPDGAIGHAWPPEQLAEWKKDCPIARLSVRLLDAGLMTEAEAEAVQAEAEAEMDEAIRFAFASPHPTREQLVEDVYAP